MKTQRIGDFFIKYNNIKKSVEISTVRVQTVLTWDSAF